MDKRTADKLARTITVLMETLAKAAPDMAARCGDDQDPEHLARLVVIALQRDPSETERALRARVTQLERQAAAVSGTDNGQEEIQKEIKALLEAAFAAWVREVRPRLPVIRDAGLSMQREAFMAGAAVVGLTCVKGLVEKTEEALELLRDIDKYGLGPERSRRLREMIHRLTP